MPVESKAEWLSSVFTVLQDEKYSNIKAINYWHENWREGYGPEVQLRIDSSEDSLVAYRHGLDENTWALQPCFQRVSGGLKLLPPSSGRYHNAFPDFGGTEDQVSVEKIHEFEDLAGKKIVWAYFSDNWEQQIRFPEESVHMINQSHHVPYIRLMPWSDEELYVTETNYTLQRILDGVFDDSIMDWAIDLRETGIPVLIEFGVEVNIHAFPWNGYYNGAGVTDVYGDPDYPDGPERFRDAYRHIISLFREVNASNVTWFFHFNDQSDPNEWWNQPEYYYPGDDYIDWVGASIYGPQSWQEKWVDYSFPELLENAYAIMKNISSVKPFAILEFGADENADTVTETLIVYYGLPIIGIIMIIVILFFTGKKILRRRY